jgi:hypothetical protein
MERFQKYRTQIVWGALVVVLAALDLLLVMGARDPLGLQEQERLERVTLVNLERDIRDQRDLLDEKAFPQVADVRNLVLNIMQEEGTANIQVTSFSTIERAEVIGGITLAVLHTSLEMQGPLADVMGVLHRLGNASEGILVLDSIQARETQGRWKLTVLVKVYAERQ